MENLYEYSYFLSQNLRIILLDCTSEGDLGKSSAQTKTNLNQTFKLDVTALLGKEPQIAESTKKRTNHESTVF